MNAPQEMSIANPTPARPFVGWLEHHWRSAWHSLGRLGMRPFASLLTIAVMGLTLALPLTFYLLLGNLQAQATVFAKEPAINVFLATAQTATQAEQLAQALRERPDVAEVILHAPDDALKQLAAQQGLSGSLVLMLDHNPLPWALEVTARGEPVTQMVDRLVSALRAMPGVAQVQDDNRWRQRLAGVLELGRRVIAVLAVLLVLVALLVVGNSVRTDIDGRSEEIAVLAMLGASPAFVRCPFLYAGFWYGLLGGLVALGLLGAAEYALSEPASALHALWDRRLNFQGLPLELLMATPLFAAALGWFAARLSSAWRIWRMTRT